MPEHDYNVCPETDDGKHQPRAGVDLDMPAGYLVVECAACFQTTGTPIPDDLEWN
jgi:hypothetical protein